MNNKKNRTAITPTRSEDYPEWYQQVIKAADLAEGAPVRGCMIIKQWGYGIWESIQQYLDGKIKETGHENVYFPMFIPMSFLEKEASHVEGFAKECAVVTHHRLEERDGKLIPTGKLDEPLVIRPTSETIIGVSFSKWIQSHRDLPLLINQWANIVRWEMRPRLFLRTTEFLWQEGHTAHASEEEAREETLKMLGVYCDFARDILAMPVIIGKKTESEKFPGADDTYTFEAMMQDCKALQAGTSHYLGQNFAKAFDITFLDKDSKQQHAYTTSWGLTTRLIGSLIMVHSDDDGLRLPPRVAHKHIAIIPFVTKPEREAEVMEYAEKLAEDLKGISYHGKPLGVVVDTRALRGGEKNWDWIKKGIPLRIEVGPRDIDEGKVCIARRDKGHKDKVVVEREGCCEGIAATLDEMQEGYYNQAQTFMDEHIREDIEDIETFKKFFTPKNKEKPEIHGGFVKGHWCGSADCEGKIAEFNVTIRCIPLEQRGIEGRCIVCGAPADTDVVYAKSY
jgi:prolyl-tRNA synthetase